MPAAATQFKPGQSGNPGGRPVGKIADLKRKAREYGPDAITQLAKLAGLLPGHPGAETDAAKIHAINSLLDRGYGKAAQPVTGEDGGALMIDFRWADVPEPVTIEAEPLTVTFETEDEAGTTERG